jgi:peptidoglycan/LPS O-acetylase OafA/YrhL
VFILILMLTSAVCGFIVGAVIGLVVVALVYRRRFLRGAAFGGFACVLVLGFANSGSISGKGTPWISFINDTTESLSWACPVSSGIAGLLAGIGGRRK